MKFIDKIDMKKVAENEDFNDGYYHLFEDLIKYPDAVIYVIWSQRGPGKTYSSLWGSYYNGIKPIYMKRTNDDVSFLCNHSNIEGDEENDPSPYAPINEDKCLHILPVQQDDGYGAFYHCDEENKPKGAPVSYLASLNALKKLKGINFRHADIILMDEFIPLKGERVLHAEGEMLLDFYMTVLRDRVKRGLPEVKLVLMANSENISCPITRAFEIIDDIADMQAAGEDERYIENRKILLHHLPADKYPTLGEDLGIYQCMQGTAWAEKAFGGSFSNNDFSNVVPKKSIKHYHPVVTLQYNRKAFTIYQKQEKYYASEITHYKGVPVFDLEKENDQKKFWYDYLTEFKLDLMDGNFTFQKYSYYDLFINYKNYYKV